MFTGIIEKKGKIIKTANQPGGLNLTISCPGLIKQVVAGDSVAVDGCCLTVSSKKGDSFDAYLSYQTLDNTTLGKMGQGTVVNLELALSLGSRVGGHMVTGHIDTVGRIDKIEHKGDAFRIILSLDRKYSPFIAAKGSVAVDGISLTVSEKGDQWFGIAVIPHTYHNTTLSRKKPGSLVNIEVDILARYVANYIGYKNNDKSMEEKLKKYGFIK